MSQIRRSLLTAALAIAVWEVALRPSPNASAVAQKASPATEKDNEELSRSYTEDQADRAPKAGAKLDWRVVAPRDAARLKRAKEIYEAGGLHTGADHYHAAMILQHSSEPNDYLLAHELCVVAIGKGNRNAKWLAAASEDRFLKSIGRGQRFATQYSSKGPNAPFRLDKVDPGVTDALRKEFNAPTLEQAKAREAEFNR